MSLMGFELCYSEDETISGEFEADEVFIGRGFAVSCIERLKENPTQEYTIGKAIRSFAPNLISRRHIRIKKDGSYYYLSDESRNGTSINGQRVEEGKLIKLSEGDLIFMGPKEGSGIPSFYFREKENS